MLFLLKLFLFSALAGLALLGAVKIGLGALVGIAVFTFFGCLLANAADKLDKKNGP